MKHDMTRQIGRFFVDGRFFIGLDIGDGVNLFVGMVVLDIRRDYASDRCEYIAAHEQFRAVPRGEIIPEYEAIFGATSSVPQWREKSA